ncbi:MAG: hypothetical protein QOH31_3518 [Verrucomicrobiota bacterium]|jgi:hypothetical protein
MSIRRQDRAPIGFAVLGGFCLCPAAAHAHLVQTGFGTFYDGVAHIFLTPADLLTRRRAGFCSPGPPVGLPRVLCCSRFRVRGSLAV